MLFCRFLFWRASSMASSSPAIMLSKILFICRYLLSAPQVTYRVAGGDFDRGEDLHREAVSAAELPQHMHHGGFGDRLDVGFNGGDARAHEVVVAEIIVADHADIVRDGEADLFDGVDGAGGQSIVEGEERGRVVIFMRAEIIIADAFG